MFYLLSKHYFDTMFVILCVIAGATSHTVSNTSKTSIDLLNNHSKASFIELLLDASLVELTSSSNTIDKGSATHQPHNHGTSGTKSLQQSQTVCAVLNVLLTSHQMKFCLRHQDILENVLPKIIQLTKKECIRATADLKWDCSAMELFLNRSSPLAFTREAAFIRSLLSASMMYLVAKFCIEENHRSCGCNYGHVYYSINDKPSRLYKESVSLENRKYSGTNLNILSAVGQHDLSSQEVADLDAGTPLRLTNSFVKRQGCLANIAFADAFTKIFMDSDDVKSLNKACRILNEDHHYGNSNAKRHTDTDYKELAYIKWSKSAINLHNCNVGRQLVRFAVQRRCRCHGLSGVCQFQTCWDQLADFSSIATKLRSTYLSATSKVRVTNLGSLDKTDLYLTTLDQGETTHKISIKQVNLNDRTNLLTTSLGGQIEVLNRVKTGELLFLYKSPNYCIPQLIIKQPGTSGRTCALYNVTPKKSIVNASMSGDPEYNAQELESYDDGGPGSCEHLCCNRGYRSELVLEMVTCNCRFRFCCRVDCEHCLRQRLQYSCL